MISSGANRNSLTFTSISIFAICKETVLQMGKTRLGTRAGKLQIAIVGAGIGGLAVAALLARQGHDVQIFEQFDQPRPVGSGLVIQPVGLAVLDRIGAGAAVRAKGAAITRMLGVEVDKGIRVLDVRYATKARPRSGLAIHRANLYTPLWDAAQAGGAQVTASARVTAAPRCAGGRMLLCADGSAKGPFDLVVDASGTRSPLSPLQGRPLRYGAIWGTVPWPADTRLPRDQLTQAYRAASRMAGVLPIGTMPGSDVPAAAIFWSLPLTQTDLPDRELDQWKAEAVAFWPEFAGFLTSITQWSQMVPARYSHGTLRQPYAEGLAHIGDAAHRASPQLGQGANMALLDAMALAEALTRAEGAAALALYARMRRWHVRLYQGMSATFTPQYQSDSRWLPLLRDRFLAPLSQLPPVRGLLSRLVSGDLIPPLAGVAPDQTGGPSDPAPEAVADPAPNTPVSAR